MSPEQVREMAAAMPVDLRRQRAKLVLHLGPEIPGAGGGTEEVACPICNGTMYLDAASFETCPICVGWRTIPLGLRIWIEEKNHGGERKKREGRVAVDEERILESRPGRIADRPAKVNWEFGKTLTFERIGDFCATL